MQLEDSLLWVLIGWYSQNNNHLITESLNFLGTTKLSKTVLVKSRV